MFPVIQILCALVIGIMFLEYAPLCFHPLWTPLGTLLGLLLIILVGAWLRWRIEDRFDRTREDPEARERAVLGLYRHLGWFRWSPILVYFPICWVLGWPALVAGGRLDVTILLDKIAALVPFLVALVLAWIMQFYMERILTGKDMRLRPYLGFHVRQTTLPLLPVFGLLAIADVVEASPVARLYIAAFPFLYVGMLAAFVTVIYMFSGPVMKVIFKTRPLPNESLRKRLENFAHRLGFEYRELLSWQTGLNIINAAIVGGLARFRYVLFTEGMLGGFSEEETEAVFAHEIGHAKSLHIHLYFVFALSLFFLYQLAIEAIGLVLPEDLKNDPLVIIGLFILVVATYWRVLFGFVSRKFEREADLFAALALGDPHRFIHALEEVARKSGILRKLPSWRHHSIAERVTFLESAFSDPEEADRFRRSARRVKLGLMVILVASAALVMRDVTPRLEAGKMFLEAVEAMENGDCARAKAAVRRSREDPAVERFFAESVLNHLSAGEVDPETMDILLLVDILIRFGNTENAHEVFERVIRRGESMLENGDPKGAKNLLKRVLEYRRTWDEEMDARVNEFRLELRSCQAAEERP